jgi:hypothetical protein
VAKAMGKLGLSLDDTMGMSFYKLQYLLSSYKAIEAEEHMVQSRIQDNHLYLQSKNHKEKYGDLNKSFKEIYNQYAVKTIRGFNMGALEMLKGSQKSKKKGR